MTKWIKAVDAPEGQVFIAWCDGARLPNYELVTKRNRIWYFEKTGESIPTADLFSYVSKLPMPPGELNDPADDWPEEDRPLPETPGWDDGPDY